MLNFICTKEKRTNDDDDDRVELKLNELTSKRTTK